MSFLKKRKQLQIRRYVPHLVDDSPIGIYIHVPFCVHKCPYCDFYSIPTENYNTEELYDTYTNAIITGISDASTWMTMPKSPWKPTRASPGKPK